MTERKNQPIDRVKVGRIEASIWENTGKKGAWDSVTISRTYEDSEGNLKSTSSFSGADILLAAEALRIAYSLVSAASEAREFHGNRGAA